MIVDHMDFFNEYRSLGPEFDSAFNFLSECKAHRITDGRYPIEDDSVYALVQSYPTDEEQNRQYEAHRQFIDIQYVLEGSEIIYWLPIGQAPEGTEYSEELDAVLFQAQGGSPLVMSEGFFAVLFPQDAHKPGCVLNKRMQVRKIIVKIRIQE